MNISDLERMTTTELGALAGELELDNISSLRRQELVFGIVKAHAARHGEIHAQGVLQILPDGFGFLRTPDANYQPGADDIYVSPSQIRRFTLRTGDTVSGRVRAPKESERYFALLKVETVNGEDPEHKPNQVLFDNLTPVFADRHLTLERPDIMSTRVIDRLVPIGFGQRCLIVSPPRAGRTTLLQDIARAIELNHPDVTVLLLLIDERPEDVTEMRRTVKGEVASSTFDEPAARHVQVAEIVLEKARRLVEAGQDVVLLLDSLTRLADAYGTIGQSAEPAKNARPDVSTARGDRLGAALHKPKRFFGAARNLEEGGSLTMIATALVDTGSPLDDAIFHAFSGTDNCEIRLDLGLAEQGVFPCIDINRSNTRKAERLMTSAALAEMRTLRAELRPLAAAEAIALALQKLG